MMAKFNPQVSDESVLQTCAKLAKRGGPYHVNRYRYGEENKRKTCFKLKAEGKLKQGPTKGKLLTFFRPEDVGVIEAANKKHHDVMRKIFRKNCRTMIDWARKEQQKTGVISRYYIDEFWKNKRLSWHYNGETA